MKQKVKISVWFQLKYSVIYVVVWPHHMIQVSVASTTERSGWLIVTASWDAVRTYELRYSNMPSINHFEIHRWVLPSNMLLLQETNFLSYTTLLIYNIYAREEIHYQRKGKRSSNFFLFHIILSTKGSKKKKKLCKILKIAISCH